MAPEAQASLLTIPCELRNAIYLYIFEPHESDYLPNHLSQPTNELASPLRQDVPTHYRNHLTSEPTKPPKTSLDILRTCQQIRREAQLLALSLTPFHISSSSVSPDVFDHLSRPLAPPKLNAIRHLTLTARISNLRALNEAWCNLPFGHPSLHLDVLVVVPTRPNVYSAGYAEISDLSQSHTLAYIFSETLKGLRNVRCVEVRNGACFNEVVWRLFYRSLVYRMWKWGGFHSGVRFQSGEIEEGGTLLEANRWFKAYLSGKEDEGVECGEEVVRLVG